MVTTNPQTQNSRMARYWQVAFELFAGDRLAVPAVLLIDRGDVNFRVYREAVDMAQFRTNALAAAAETNVWEAVFICKADFSFEPLPDGSTPAQAYQAVLVLVADKDGSRHAQSAAIVRNGSDISLAVPITLEIPCGVLVDEIVARGSTVH